MIEVGTTVREMDLMKKDAKEKAFLNSYVSIIQEIPDDRFDHSRVEARERKDQALEGERAAAKADCPVEKYGDIDHQLKMLRVEGLQLQVV
jgi:hypothetical protein